MTRLIIWDLVVNPRWTLSEHEESNFTIATKLEDGDPKEEDNR